MSHRGDLTERLVRIPLLLAERPWSQQELAQEFRVDGVTIRRNITELSRFYNIQDEKRGREVFYFFGEGYEFRPPNLTPSELAALLLAQQSFVTSGKSPFGTPFAEHGRTLLLKVRAALPAKLRDYLDTLANIYGSASIPAKDYSNHSDTIDKLTKAAASCHQVHMRYHTLRSGEIKDRDFDPYAVYFDPDGATLKTIGLDHNSGQIRTYSIDRIQKIDDNSEIFNRPNEFNLQEFLTENCFNGIHDVPITVRLRAYEVTASIFAERKFHPSHKIIERTPKDEDKAETTTIEMRVARGRGLERFILSWMPYIEVLDPLELREKIRAELTRGMARISQIE